MTMVHSGAWESVLSFDIRQQQSSTIRLVRRNADDRVSRGLRYLRQHSVAIEMPRSAISPGLWRESTHYGIRQRAGRNP